MRLSFDSISEVKEFVASLKGTRGKKGDEDEGATAGNAPDPLKPPAGQTFAGSAFVPQAGGAGPQGGGPFAAAAPVVAPEVLALVTRIVSKLDAALASGQPADQALTWFRGQCGPEAAAFDMNQIKTIALPKMSAAQLDGIAKLMNA